ncbi:MAG: TIGR02206 family membrane protein, partial [Verrucomicrobiota bacterium]
MFLLALQAPPFELFGLPHLIVLTLIPILTIGLCQVAKRAPVSRTVRVQNWTLALVLLLCYPLKLWSAQIAGWPGMPLPMHLCDWAAILGALTLIKRRHWMAELVWFWGITGTVQGLLTPALAFDFPHPRFIAFFILHASVVICSFYVVFGLGMAPRPGAVWRAFGSLQIYTLLAILFNLLANQNYGFLCQKPLSTSLLSFL